MKKIQGTMSLVFDKKVENVTDAQAKYNEMNIGKVQVLVTFMDGSTDTLNINDHFVEYEE